MSHMVTGAQGIGSSCAPFLGKLVGKWIRNGAARTPNALTVGGGLTYCAMVLAQCISSLSLRGSINKTLEGP